jgi:hypothetical protein
LVLVAAIGLSLASSAMAWHGGEYWFFQGYLPTAGGDRTAGPHENQCCSSPQWIRMSWTAPSHDMTFIAVRRSDYGWTGLPAYTFNGYDQTAGYYVEYYTAGGCQNPPFLSLVWTNCRVGNNV